MNEVFYMIFAWVCGFLTGTLFFGGLWITVKKAVHSKTPALWFAASFILRMAIVLSGFYYVSQGHWQRLLICLFGFLVARFFIIRFTRATAKTGANKKGGVS
jgi:F1F0 ATPase subunit 2